MPRTGLSTLIATLRQLTHAGTADVTLNAITYFTDDHLQTELDRTQRTWRRVPLQSAPVLVNGGYEYYDYQFPAELGSSFESAATDSGWAVKDGTGATQGTASYTTNYAARNVTFSTDQHGAAYYLDCRTYDLNYAAAAVWRQKAGFCASNVDWQSDNHHISAAQEYEHCLRMVAHFESLAGATQGRFVRADETTHW
jgi:hypothetical protein